MSTAALSSFDTLQFAKRLKEAGLPEPQAEGQAEVLRQAFDERDRAFAALENRVSTQKLLAEKESEQLASKSDVLKLDAKIDSVRKDFETLRWIMGLVLGGIIALLIRAYS